ncbi:MAG: aldo/keto reductase, partial [Treponema sp.]|nr:aldo/keto reductase [Treponema sp.]
MRREMQYRSYGRLGYEVSLFGMGCMRLPRIVRGDHAEVDREKAYEMIRYAADHGVNYFDTAYGYHNLTSEEVLGEALEGGRREKVKIA